MKSHLATTIAVGLFLSAYNAAAITRYVDLNSPSPTPPYTSWATAAVSIQDAVDATSNGDTVVVTDGVYATGGRMWFGSGTNRVTITNSIILQSVNGPLVTVIQGAHASSTNAVRCVMLTTNALLSGFTLTNGQSGIGNYPQGGGVHCSAGSIVSNCILAGNLANASGGGAYMGTLLNCMLKGNAATTSGGGTYNANLLNCILTGNSAMTGGGLRGVYGSTTAKNCLIVSNTASASGGAASAGSFVNCTIVGNAAGNSMGAVEGSSGLDNCIVYYNTAPIAPNGVGKFENICLQPPMPGYGSGFTNEPAFAGLATGDFHLQSNSPCINSGRDSYITNSTDLAGNPRIAGGAVDIGAYEFQSPASELSYAWALQNGLPTDGSADYADPDGDGHNNWQEWRADTIPTNALSVFRLQGITNVSGGINLTWQSTTTRSYWLQRLSHFGGALPFQTIATNIAGVNGIKSFTDFTATNIGPYFYRIGVQP